MNDPNILKTNDEIARKFGRIEADIALCHGIGELFERLLSGSEEAFGIPFVWLSLLRRPETEKLRKLLGKSEILQDRINIMDPAPFLEIVPDFTHPLLVSGDLRPFFRLMPPNVKYFLRSLAIAPLTRHGVLIGSLNHGDASPDRYRHGMDTALLDHLSGTVSEHLSRLLPPLRSRTAGKKD
jgi:two-component system cell cycle response regulator